ncbi:SGNH/GDSL hydrolase family protein [Mucilaginibacter sp. KACC 22063]|uniref:SGNH/GDSL hydrolase family protein n=1 Tax=Mucilaginibacter sp. KACC 22063 TaxID=3025666 RepID=UPI0023662BD2|nr:SGNH/GDSL hydrolase family protein [Mucilaginibacter sp. KACC 22063]WDF53898.1 SGNH/GDSL hydrolase family protein [Mucilaginibacter sp. KACC 22063]
MNVLKTLAGIALPLLIAGSSYAQIAKTDSAARPKPQPAKRTADWANVNRYAEANEQVRNSGVNPVAVYMGDSITDFWIKNDSSFFSSNNYIDRGISGQTTTQMLVRFRQDVINLHPKVVVILAGINDIAQNNGPITLPEVFGNIQSMAILAKEAGIKVVLCSVLPANHFRWRPEIDPSDKVIELNNMIKEYSAKKHLVYLDYYSAMVDGQKGLPEKLSPDGVHPNPDGYKIMEPLAKQAINKAL